MMFFSSIHLYADDKMWLDLDHMTREKHILEVEEQIENKNMKAFDAPLQKN
jgi:hypothetical protein